MLQQKNVQRQLNKVRDDFAVWSSQYHNVFDIPLEYPTELETGLNQGLLNISDLHKLHNLKRQKVNMLLTSLNTLNNNEKEELVDEFRQIATVQPETKTKLLNITTTYKNILPLLNTYLNQISKYNNIVSKSINMFNNRVDLVESSISTILRQGSMKQTKQDTLDRNIKNDIDKIVRNFNKSLSVFDEKYNVQGIQTKMTRFIDGYTELKQLAHYIDKSVRAMKSAFQIKNTGSINAITIPDITEYSKIPIFDITPPPVIQLSAFKSSKDVQSHVTQQYAQFKWPIPQITPGGECKQSAPWPPLDIPEGTQTTCSGRGDINIVQRLSYHYMIPQSSDVNIMLVHSTGAGKTCTATLIASIFGRMGYTIAYITKKSLIGSFVDKTAIMGNCDFNLQQVTSVGKGTLRDLISELDISKKMKASGKSRKDAVSDLMISKGRQILTQMGVHLLGTRPVLSTSTKKPTDDAFDNLDPINRPRASVSDHLQIEFSYDQLGNLADSITGGRIKKYWNELTMKGNGTPKDPVRRCLFVIDEAHKIIGPSSDKALGNPLVVYQKIRNMLWRSREISGTEAARVLLITATPMPNHVCDLVNLVNLLAPKEDCITDFFDTNPSKMYKNFDETYLNNDGTLKNTEKFDRLFRGRISYFDYSKDRNRFAFADQHFIRVQLSELQEKGIRKCFRGVYKLRNGRYGTSDDNVKLTNKQFMDRLKCVQLNVVWPKLENYNHPVWNRGIAALLKDDKFKGFADEDMLKVASPVLYELSKNVGKHMTNMLAKHERHQNVKQYIFTDASSRTDNNYGVDVIARVLQDQLDMVRVNYEIKKSSGKVAAMRDTPPYKGMIVLDGRTPVRSIKKELLNRWKSNNTDGKQASVFINSGAYKEGIDVWGVGIVHIVGYIQNISDLIQSVARAIRNCSHAELPFHKNGWPMTVLVYIPEFKSAQPYLIREMLDGMAGSQLLKNTAMTQMTSLMQNSAYDKQLLENINNALSEPLTLHPPVAMDTSD